MIKHIVFSILMFICSLSIYSDVPNEVITKNPKKEVTTINSEKNRDYANMSITVNKINIIDIKGKKLKDGIVFSILKKDKDLLSNKEYIAVELLPQLQKFNKSIKKDLENEIPILLKEDEIKKTFKSLKFKDSKEFYVLEINKKNNRINKVYKILSESKEEIGMVYNTIYAPLYAKKGQILDYISEDIELENIPFSQTRTLSTESKITFNDEYISNKTGVNLDIGAMYFGQFWYNFFNDILPSINLVNMDKAQNLSKPSNYTRIGDSIIANYFKEAHIVSFYKALSMKDGIYFEPTSNQILGTYKVSGTFSKDGTIFRRAEAKIEVTRNPEKTQITLSPIAPLNTELKTREQNNYLDIVNLKEDLSYVTKQNKNRITLRAEDNSKVTDVSTTTTRAIKLEKDGCIIKVEYKQVNGETAKPIITKLKEANAQQTFNIKVGMLAEDMRTYLNGEDTLIINVEPKSTIDIGEVVFNIDKRINSLSESWIKADGSVSQGVDRLQDNYSALVNVTNNFNNLTSTNISDVMKINNRNISEIRTSYDSTRYKIFLKAAGNYKDESAMPLNINLNDLKSRLMISKNNEGTTDEALNNRFILKGENNLLYEGNIKENYVGEEALEGIGTLDLTALNHNQWTRWEITKLGGTIPSNAGISSQLILSSGKLFNWKSAINPTGHIVTRLKVMSNGIIDDINNNEIRERIETSKFIDNKIGIEANGLFIHKLSLKSEPVNYIIEAYHKDVLLGKLNITITNNRKTNIGEVVFNIDRRIESLNGDWIKVGGNVSRGLTNLLGNYNSMITTTGNFNNLTSTNISDIITINNRTVYQIRRSYDNINYEVFLKANENYKDESAMPLNINLNDLKSRLMISKNNEGTTDEALNNRFILKGENNLLYEGNIKENYVGEEALEGIGTLDLTALNHNQWTRWEITKLGGTIPSNAGISSQLILSSGKLFDWRSPLSSSEHIVTRLRVTSNEIVDDINYNNEVRERIETSRFSDNKIGIDRAGLYIHKLSLKSEPVNYVIEAYHKDVLLGKLNVTVTNNRKTNIGEVVFNIDKRIQSAVGKWMTSEGKLYNGFSDNSPNNYRNMLNVDGEFTQIASRIKEVRSINNENNFLTNSPSIGNIKYKIIQPNSDYYDESAMPYEIPFNSLRSNLIISTLNRNTEDNRFVLRGDDGVLYEGNVKEKYIGEIALEGTGTLDLTGLNLGEWSSWNQVKGSGDLQSNTSQGGKSSILKMGNNKLFDWTSQLPNGNTPIVTKLKITKNNEESKEKVIEIGNRVEIEFTDNKIGIDRNGLFIHKLSSKSEPVNYLIEAYYGEILLGKLNLKVENGHGFSIIDGDRIDFGDFFPGDSKEVSTIIEIKNPLEANIDIKLSDTSRNEMYKSGVKINSNTTIPIKNINVVELNTIGKDINSFKISATAVTTKDTVVGEYSGEIEVTITIIPK